MLTPTSSCRPTSFRASAQGRSVWPRWTPSAPASSATSGRSLTMTLTSRGRQRSQRAAGRGAAVRRRPAFSHAVGCNPRRLRPRAWASRHQSRPGQRSWLISTHSRHCFPGRPVPIALFRSLFEVVAAVAEGFSIAGGNRGRGFAEVFPYSSIARSASLSRLPAAITTSATDPRTAPQSVLMVVPTSPGVSRLASSPGLVAVAGPVVPQVLEAFAQFRIVEHEPRGLLHHPQGLAGPVGIGVEDAQDAWHVTGETGLAAGPGSPSRGRRAGPRARAVDHPQIPHVDEPADRLPQHAHRVASPAR